MEINYGLYYRLGLHPWEHYAKLHLDNFDHQLQVEIEQHAEASPGVLPRAIDLGCGSGIHCRRMAAAGFEVVGVDAQQRALVRARDQAGPHETYLQADVTDLSELAPGFNFFLDSGCLQGLVGEARSRYGHAVNRLAAPGATFLTLQFGNSRFSSFIGGISREELEDVLPRWALIDDYPAETRGLGWLQKQSRPHWYRFLYR